VFLESLEECKPCACGGLVRGQEWGSWKDEAHRPLGTPAPGTVPQHICYPYIVLIHSLSLSLHTARALYQGLPHAE